jgi:hypothetical protein
LYNGEWEMHWILHKYKSANSLFYLVYVVLMFGLYNTSERIFFLKYAPFAVTSSWPICDRYEVKIGLIHGPMLCVIEPTVKMVQYYRSLALWQNKSWTCQIFCRGQDLTLVTWKVSMSWIVEDGFYLVELAD